jgi:hypothetical protein
VKVDQLVPAVQSRVEFSLKARKFVPSAVGCYVLSTFEHEILYVGLTDDLNRRFFQHRETPEKSAPTPVGRAFWFHYLQCPEHEINRIERTWLNEHLEMHGVWPVLNKANSPLL